MSVPDPARLRESAIGALHHTFRFPTPAAAKAAWEAVQGKRSLRHISAWRYASIDDPDRGVLVTVMGEESVAANVAAAARMCQRAGGVEFEQEQFALDGMRLRRFQHMERSLVEARANPGRTVFRDTLRMPEGGAYLNLDGTFEPRQQGRG